MATITCLPEEVIKIILNYSDISSEDIFNFRFAWMQLHSTNESVFEYWERTLSQRWPSANKVYAEQYKENEKTNSDEIVQQQKRSIDFIETGINYAKQLQEYVSQIVYKHNHESQAHSIGGYYYIQINNSILFQDVFHLDEHLTNNIDEIINKPEHFIKYCFFIDECKNLLIQSLSKTDCNLTKQYCYAKLFCYMRQLFLKNKWNIKIERQPNQLLERMSTIMVRLWYMTLQPERDISYSWVKTSLDNIALGVLNYLREKYPDHSIFSISAETFTYWKNNNIDENHWNEAEGTQIIDILDEYIFDKLNFRTTLDHENFEHLCIDNVLRNKYGQEQIVSIIYHSVARRLGLRCDVIKLSYNSKMFGIFWKLKYSTKNLENARYFRINSYQVSDKRGLLRTLYSFKEPCKIEAKEMWYEIKELFFPSSPFPYETFNVCYKITEPINIRTPEIKYAVGMIVKHNFCRSDCTGVIIGWARHEYVSVERNSTLPRTYVYCR
ncbi:uncharacterized protein LOC114934494 [Nylanderia fulva]|uniref:uncharacterized protein LOC114934494 n=1 Tax=Nylanderia fulva TaxID=613905 RepID=UPI0010FB7F98|nr:uncharacterized protein LOC114934494 [Nylanderia fulva]